MLGIMSGEYVVYFAICVIVWWESDGALLDGSMVLDGVLCVEHEC